MKKILLGLLILTTFVACSNYGKKVKIEGTKGEVYYKGDGVNEDDAKKIGAFLKQENFFTDSKGASVQITKEGEAYTLRFVYDKDVYDTLKGAENLFKQFAIKASKEVLGGKKVNIALANKTFKDYKNIAFDENLAKELDAPTDQTGTVQSKADFKHKEVDDVDYYWYGIPDEEAKMIYDYITTNGEFRGGAAELYITQDNGRYLIRFPMIESARTDPATLALLEKVSRQIKDNVFKETPYSFYATDEQLNVVKAYDY